MQDCRKTLVHDLKFHAIMQSSVTISGTIIILRSRK